MSKTVSYTLSLIDRMSTPMRTISGTSTQTVSKLNSLQTQSKALKAATTELGGSLSTLRQRMDLLKAEKELINPKNIKDIRTYNREIESLEKQIDKLDNTGRKGGLSKYISETKASLGGFINPLTMAVAGVGMAFKGGMNLDEQFAKVNVTAKLEGADFAKMKSDIVDLAKKNKVDVLVAPQAFEKIISQTNDVGLSMQILDSTLKGSKAGFTDVSVVADALAQSLSIVGKENASASQILDTFFAAKRVGAGEFKDFANYMPSLIAGADALGMKYQEVAGIYAYMTGKGQSAERASVLMNNMFSMLGRGEVVDKLSKAGINVFDNGKLRSSVDIFRDMSSVMAKMNDQQKSNFVEALGVVDKEAKSAFMVMTADVDKLSSSLTEVANSAGETDAALALSANAVQRAKELWNSFNTKITAVGEASLPLINTGIILLGGALDVVSVTLGGATSFLGGWYDMLENGNPLIWAATTALGAAGLMLAGQKIKLMAVSAWNTITAGTTGLLGRAMTALNASMLSSPIGWLLLGVGAIAGAMYALGTKTDKATKAFAEFNTELSKSKKETKEGFDVAMQAAQGSDARKEAIRKLNEQYGSYLPNLISEKANNDELAGALNVVNIQLEQKLKLKYRDQLIGDAQNKLMAAETAMLETALSGIEDSAIINKLVDKVKATQANIASGNISPGAAWQELDKFKWSLTGEKLGIARHINGTSTSYVPFEDYKDANDNLSKANKIADAQFGVTMPTIDSATTTTNSATLVGSTDLTTLMGKLGGKSSKGSSSSNVFDLDQQIVNSKGSTAYNAVVSKLNKVKMAGLTAASVVGLSTASPAFTMPQTSDASTTQFAVNGADNEDYSQKQKTLNLDKFCDQIVIHIANANDKGYDKIRSEIIKVLKEVADGQRA